MKQVADAVRSVGEPLVLQPLGLATRHVRGLVVESDAEAEAGDLDRIARTVTATLAAEDAAGVRVKDEVRRGETVWLVKSAAFAGGIATLELTRKTA